MQSNFNEPHNKVFIRSWKIYNVRQENSVLIYWFLGIFAAEYVYGASAGWGTESAVTAPGEPGI